MFDRVYFHCLDCRCPIEVQSKAGECVLANIDNEAVPVGIATDIVGQTVWCQYCRRPWTIETAPSPLTVALRLR